MNVKQVIVMRKDLGVRKGKLIAQGAHASMKIFFDRMMTDPQGSHPIWFDRVLADPEATPDKLECGNITHYLAATDEMKEWIKGSFTKICVSVNSEEELLEIYNKAKDAGLPCALICDAGKTEFNGVPTNTCCAIGPDQVEKIDKITGDLKLL